MNCLSILDQIADAGICSFKIEGRMKSPYYVATVTNAYRHATDKTGDTDMLLRELETISHRPYADGFYFGEVKKNHNNSGAYTSSHIFVGVVKEVLGGGLYRVEERNKFSKGETIEVLSPHTVGLSFTVQHILEDDAPVDSANKPMKDYVISCPHTLHAGDFLRKPN